MRLSCSASIEMLSKCEKGIIQEARTGVYPPGLGILTEMVQYPNKWPAPEEPRVLLLEPVQVISPKKALSRENAGGFR